MTAKISVSSVSNGVAKGSSKLPAQLTIHVSMFICFQPSNHRNYYTAIFSRRTGSQFAFALLCNVTQRQVDIILLYGLPRFLVFVFLCVIVLVFVRFSHCNFYFYIVFISQIVIVLVFVLTERSAIVLVFVFVFVRKIALPM